MILYHRDEPVDNIIKYKELLIEMKNSYINTFNSNTILKTWQENEKIKRKIEYYRCRYSSNSDDYEIIIDFGEGRNPDNHYYILFPKNPNSFKVVSNLHARGQSGNTRDWLHDWLVKFTANFPKTFELYYGDGQGGYGEYEVLFKNGLGERIIRPALRHGARINY